MPELIDRIGPNYLNATFTDGQILTNGDLNEIVSVTKEAINANYRDIQRIEHGEITVGRAVNFDGATLSKFINEPLQADDKKVPTSLQVKNYVDEKIKEVLGA